MDHPMLRHRVTTPGVLILSVLLSAPALDGAPRPDPQQATFRASVDLIAVEVQVVDSNGHPISALDRGEFEVTIDRRKRTVVSAELIETWSGEDGPSLGPFPSAPAGGVQRSDLAGRGRTFILAVDAGSFEAGAALPIIAAAQRFINQLQHNDLVGVFALPPFGPRVDPTSDRGSVRRALDGVIGQRQSLPGQFHLSPSEIIDISSEARNFGPRTASGQAAAARGAQVLMTPETEALQRVQLRECRRTTDIGCTEGIVSEASMLAHHLEERATRSLDGIAALLETIQRYPGRKTVVVISGGMPVSDRPGGRVNIGNEARALGGHAAQANATIYALHVDGGLAESYSAQSRRTRDFVSLARERRLSAQLLDEFAGASGGTLLSVLTGNAEIALDRVLRETSAYYLLGVEPDAADRDGRPRQLNVKVDRSGTTVRSRQWVVVPGRAAR